MKRASRTVQDANGSSTIRVGVSSCLLGEKVRFDGGHKNDDYLSDVLGKHFTWVPVCPELEVGMGVPREAVHLTVPADSPRMAGVKSGEDWTDRMMKFSERRLRELEKLRLHGFIFKSKSPSCGLERIKIYAKTGQPVSSGRGLFADAFVKRFPLTPIEEEGRLRDMPIRESFLTRVFAYRRLCTLIESGVTRSSLIEFHAAHKYLLLAHSPKHYQSMGRLVAAISKAPIGAATDEYGRQFMDALKIRTTVKKNVNVLQHIFGFLKDALAPAEKSAILGVIEDYHREFVPLIVPVTLLNHYVNIHKVDYIRNQVYLHPNPKELMLRNHI